MAGYQDIFSVLHEELVFLFVTATEIETSEFLSHMDAHDVYKEIVSLPLGNQTYSIGKFGCYNTVHVQCGSMGAAGRDSSIITIFEATNHWTPDAIIMVGIAFGKDHERQQIGDVLVSQSIVNYESIRISDDEIQLRSHNVESGKILFNRIQNERAWEYMLPDGSKARKISGTILSGEKLIDSSKFKDSIFETYPVAIGGEMESYGMYAVATSQNIHEWIMVKGICDWADGEKRVGKTEKQKIAIMSAVSLCKQVFSQKILDDIPRNSKRPFQQEVHIIDSRPKSHHAESSLLIKVERCDVRDLNFPEYSFQIDLAINATSKAYFRSACLIHEGLFSEIIIPVNYIYDQDKKTEYLKLEHDNYIDVISAKQANRLDSLVLEREDWRFVSILAIATGERLPDSYEYFPLHNWTLRIIYNDRQEDFPLDFRIHPSSSKVYTDYRYEYFDR